MNHEYNRYLRPPHKFLMARPWVFIVILLIFLSTIFLPWYAFTSGIGRVTAVDPNERIQEINAPLGGFIEKWHVSEGTWVSKGDLIAEIIDSDPGLMARIQKEGEAALEAYQSAQLGLNTAKINLDRQERLFKEGLSARKEYEKAKIEYSKLSVEVSKAMAILTKAQTQVSRQSTQKILASSDGRILRIIPGEGNRLIKPGEPLVVFAPKVKSPAVEIWIRGNDLPFVKIGQKARIQLEGWPFIQIAGWPSLAIGAFDAKVKLIDHASSFGGKFRVLLVPANSPWPSASFLRLNSNARGIIYLRKTLVGIELWRQLNDFPPVQDVINDELGQLLKKDSSIEAEKKGEEK